MSLTGVGLQILLGLCATTVLVILASGRPRLRRFGYAVAARAALVLTFGLLVLATAAAILNAQYAFYANWSDLLGGEDNAATVSQHGAQPAQAVSAPVAPAVQTSASTALSGASKVTIKDRFLTAEVTGSHSHLHQHVKVYLPKGYDPSKRGGYPVIVAMHGFPGNTESFKAVGDFYTDIDHAVATGKMLAPIVVVPAINPETSFDSECVDSARGPKVLTWVSEDLPDWVRHNLNAATNRSAWATWGYSFGGYCAVSTAMHQPHTFGAAVAFQPYFRPDFGQEYRPFTKASPEYRDADLVRRASESPVPVAVWLMTSQQDPLSYPSTREFVDAARSPLSVTAVIGKGGGHRMQVWARKVPNSFEWMGKNLPGFAPTRNMFAAGAVKSPTQPSAPSE